VSAQSFDVPAHRLEHEVRIVQYRGVVEAQNRIASLGQPGVPVGVARFGQAMNPAVSLNDQLESVASASVGALRARRANVGFCRRVSPYREA